MRKNFNVKIKKISAAIITLFLLFGFLKTTNALTLADIELLISVGLIPTHNAHSARNFVNTGSVTGASVTVKTDLSSSSECLVINQNLVRGRSGTLISALQTFLQKNGHFPKDQPITGFFGDMTAQAVINFQLANGLITSSSQAGAGNVGPVTSRKIQEVSCRDLSESNIPATVVSTVSTTAIAPTPIVSTASLEEDAPKVFLNAQQRNSNVDLGQFEFRYNVRVEPKEDVAFLEIIVICDPSAVQIKTSYLKVCGEYGRVKTTTSGTKPMGISYKNVSRAVQPVILVVEAIDKQGNSMGTAEIMRETTPSKPTFTIDPSTNRATYYNTSAPVNNICNKQDQLEFIRYTMTRYNPENPAILPACWPGKLLCNKSYPPTYCEIEDGPTSDDLCLSSQTFVNGTCVPGE